MSYKQAWDLINHMNTHFSLPVVISHRGGKGGGSAVITDHGSKMIRQFHTLHQNFQEFLAANSENIQV